MRSPILRGVLIATLAAVAAPFALARDIFIEPDAPLVARVYADTLRMRNPADARQAIVATLRERFATENGIVAEPAEIDAHAESLRRTLEADRLRWIARQEEIDRRLGERTLPEAERKTLAAERQVLRTLLRSEPGVPPTATPPEGREFIRWQAAGYVKQWKVDRALHRQYGGRIAGPPGAPEPVDAHRRFLEDRHARGDFQILAPELEREFWKYYRTDSMHVFLPPGSREEAQAFATPPWEKAGRPG
jgi:hypothetical protein